MIKMEMKKKYSGIKMSRNLNILGWRGKTFLNFKRYFTVEKREKKNIKCWNRKGKNPYSSWL